MVEADATGQRTPTSADMVALLAEKWLIDVLHAVRAGDNRYGQMLRHIPDITRKMLTQTLRKLERNGILERVDYQENPPRVEYFITHTGDALIRHLTQMCEWSKAHFANVERARQRFDSSEGYGRVKG